ncbi:MAG: hypothetical protein KAJ63_07715 [Methyloprofundus sp.]|nr:hypothetical protein [Methyloprofundus sp.]
MKASKQQVIDAIEYLDNERGYYRDLKSSKTLIEMALKQQFDADRINWDMDIWFHSGSREKLEGVDYRKGYFDEKHPNGRTIWL